MATNIASAAPPRKGRTRIKRRRLIIAAGLFIGTFLAASFWLGATLTRDGDRLSLQTHMVPGQNKYKYNYPRWLEKQDEDRPFTREFPALMCASRASSETMCQVKACSNTESSLLPHYGYGFVHRPASLRDARMILGGEAKAGSGCAISHQYQFLYIHVLKSGGMTVKAFLKQGLCRNSTKMPCAAGPEFLEIVSCRSSLAKYPHYFVWSFVRNPFSRMYSSYAMALDYNHRRSRVNVTLPPFEFDTYVFAKNLKRDKRRGRWELSKRLGNHSEPKPIRRLLQERRARYRSIDQLIQGINHMVRPRMSMHDHPSGLGTQQCQARKALTYMDPVHCQPQHSFLFDGQHCPVFDFLGHLEHFAEDLQKVLEIIQSPELDQHYQAWLAAGSHKQKSTSFGSQQKQAKLGGNLQRAYNYSAGLREAVAMEYALDFELLGYDPQVVPA